MQENQVDYKISFYFQSNQPNIYPRWMCPRVFGLNLWIPWSLIKDKYSGLVLIKTDVCFSCIFVMAGAFLWQNESIWRDKAITWAH